MTRDDFLSVNEGLVLGWGRKKVHGKGKNTLGRTLIV